MPRIVCFILLFTLAVFNKAVNAKEDTKLIFVQVVFRHGDRAPINLYPNDPNPASFWIEGLSALTKLGRKQHYALGKYLHKRYENFITSSPLEVNVISSEADRCRKSAETNIASFFAPEGKWKFEENFNWQPIAIQYVPKSEDKYMETDCYCPKAFEEQKRIVDSPEGQAFIAKHQEMFDNLTFYSGSPITDWLPASYLHDVLFIEKKYNLTVPTWIHPYWDELKLVSDLSFYWSFNSPLMHRLRAGPLLQKIIEMMELKLSGDIPHQKVQVYSGHDTNVAVILDALNIFNMIQPPYCATLLFELHEMENGTKSVRLLYLNSTRPESEVGSPYVLTLKGCTEFCPLDYFVNYTKDLIPDDWEKECQLSKSFLENIKNKNMVVALFIGVSVIIIMIMSFYSLWKLNSRNRDKYSYHLMPME